MVTRLVDEVSQGRRFGDALEIGYGSGIFLPELARRSDRVHGVDVHDRRAEVDASLRSQGVQARLYTASAESMPLADASMDLVVALSALEFIDDLDAVAGEVARVLRPGGLMVLVTPGKNPVLDTGLRLLTSEQAEDTFEGRRGKALPALERRLTRVRERTFPRFARGPIPTVYTAVAYSA